MHRCLLGKDSGDDLSGRGLLEVNKVGMVEEPNRGSTKLECLHPGHKENIMKIKRQSLRDHDRIRNLL